MNILQVPLDELVLDPNLNLRDRLDDFTVERYADSWERLPPITVFEVDGRLLIADGFHRHAAAIMMGKRDVPAEVRPGSFTEALDFVASVNLFHGLPLTRAERRRAVEVKLKLHPDWSDRRMAQELAVSRELVAKVRDLLIKSNQIPHLPGRVGADGKLYTSAGLPKDRNEHLPRDNESAGAGAEDGRSESRRSARDRDDEAPSERGRRGMSAAAPPWDDVDAAPGAHPHPGHDARPHMRPDDGGPFPKQAALAEPIEPAAATIDEMLEFMAKQIQDVVNWTKAEGFDDAYRAARHNTRALFQTAAFNLGNRANQLLKVR